MKLSFFVPFSLFLLLSCTKNSPDSLQASTAPFQYTQALSGICLKESDNNQYISEDIFGRFYGNYIYFNLPPGTNTSNLLPTFFPTELNTNIFINTLGQEAGKKRQDFSSPVVFLLQSPQGRISTYTIFSVYDSESLPQIEETILQQLSPVNLETHIRKLSSIPTRLNRSEGNSEALQYIEEIMDSYGYITKQQVFNRDGYQHENLLCYKRTRDPQNNPVVLSAHYDSINHENTLDTAPGADDNATGVSFLIETARLLSQIKTRPLMFVFFDSEEQGLWGSQYFVHDFIETGSPPTLDFTVDMIGGFKTQISNTVSIMEYQKNDNAELNKSSRTLGTELLTYLYEYANLTAKREYVPCSDFVPFMDQGIPSIGLIEGDYSQNPNYHNDHDTFENLNQDYFYNVCRGAFAFILYKTRL